MSLISSHIDRLRTLRADTTKKPTLDQLRLIVNDVFEVVPLEDTLKRPALAGFTVEDVTAIVEDYGKFRARSAKGETKATAYSIEEFCYRAGMLWPPTRSDLIAWNTTHKMWAARDKRSQNSTIVNLPDEMLVDPAPVVIPMGYDLSDLGRNIRASLAAMVKDKPTDAALERYYNRRYEENADELTAEHLHMVWWLASLGLHSRLDDLDGNTEMLNRMLVSAHDVLETFIHDAQYSLRVLADSEAWRKPVDDLTELLGACDWTHPGLFSRIAPVVETLSAGESERTRQLLRTRLVAVAAWWKNEAKGLRDIGQLNEAHLRMLVERSGLAYDAAEEKEVRSEIRTRLVELGFTADLDQEVPAGVAAWRQGRLADFYTSREARAAGDQNWAQLYRADGGNADKMVPAEPDYSVSETAEAMAMSE